MSPRGFAIIIGAGPTSGAGIARVLASPDHGNLAVALLARNPDNLSSLCSDLRKTSKGVFQPFPTDTGADNLRRTFKEIAEHDDFKDLKLKLAIYHVKHSSKKPFLEETAEAFTDSMQTYTTGAFVFAQEALKLFYAQNGGQTLLSETWRADTRTGKKMAAEEVGKTYLWLSQQPSSLWVHELDLRPAQEAF
ncbi:hypothetical protein BN1723_002269 [Verticillium longisporum]|uniref:Ketoreductase (KR) domain-containing protein n=1 Tax=Verticillium longisporum TaxID=100787 RepID=A0A0G4L289_VERLO|nr:hypothetical protein BN1723_002269 [Verticillium longisporum]